MNNDLAVLWMVYLCDLLTDFNDLKKLLNQKTLKVNMRFKSYKINTKEKMHNQIYV